MNACPMVNRCLQLQQGDGLYTIDGISGRGFELTDTPMEAAPSDAGVDGHAEFYMPGEGPHMAEYLG